MSSYRKNAYNKITISHNKQVQWNDIWDALYYNFIHNNKIKLSKNYSTANAVSRWNNKSNEERKKILIVAKGWFLSYC